MYNGQKLLNSEYLLCLFFPCTSLLASLHMWEHVCIVSLLGFFCIPFVDYFMMGYGLPVSLDHRAKNVLNHKHSYLCADERLEHVICFVKLNL